MTKLIRIPTWLLALSFLLIAAVVMASAPLSLSQILANDKLWGKDFPAALSSLKAWQAAGASKVLIFPNRVVSATPYTALQPAQADLTKFTEALRAAPPQPQAPFQKLMAAAPTEQFRAEVVPFAEDDSQRVAWSAKSASLLAPDLTITRVKKLLGPPQKVSTQLLENKRDMRPVVLTLYSYANGSVVFAESDYGSPRDAVNRVILDVPAADRILFK